MSPEQFDSIKRYVGFTGASSETLRRFFPRAAPHLPAVVDDFYAAIQAHPEAAAVIQGGSAQVERLKKTLIRWLEEVLVGPHDAAFLESHCRIGRVHVRIALPQEFMFTAMNRIRSRLVEVAAKELAGSEEESTRVQLAVHQMLDLELAIMLDTYREDLMQKIRVQERLATIGQLSATVAHELRNPLGTVESSMYLMGRQLEKLGIEDPVLAKHQAKIAGQVAECSRIIASLLDLARDRPLRPRNASVAEFVRAAWGDVARPPGVRTVNDVPEDLQVHGDREQLKMGLANLLRNAVQAVSGAGEVTVDAKRKGGQVVIGVSDDGPGVDPNARHRIFEILFTTKSSGTGLGLALARRVCESHGGTLELVPSERGARFEMRLPAAGSMDAPVGPVSASSSRDR